MRQANGELAVSTYGPGLIEITRDVIDWLDRQDIESGLLTVFCRHTSASLLITENAAPAVRRDIERFMAQLAPEGGGYEHEDEGPDDMPAHLRTVLTDVTLSIPVAKGRPVLGTWQGIYLFEHRAAPHQRRIALHVIGE